VVAASAVYSCCRQVL